jgi:hypothetical protein
MEIVLVPSISYPLHVVSSHEPFVSPLDRQVRRPVLTGCLPAGRQGRGASQRIR